MAFTPVAGSKAGVPGNKMRGVPDVAGCADPSTGWNIVVDETGATVVGGTSAVAPMWAAIAAYLSASLGSNVGNLSASIYALASGAMRDITSGNNGTYVAKAGYDCCTGLGVPVVTKLLGSLQPQPVPVPVPTPTPTPAATRTIVVTGTGLGVTVDGKTV